MSQQSQRHRVGASDPKLTMVEVYNPYGFEIHMVRDKSQDAYVRQAGIFLGKAVYKIPPNGHQLIPHWYYKSVDLKGDLVQVLANFGAKIGIQNKEADSPIATKLKKV